MMRKPTSPTEPYLPEHTRDGVRNYLSHGLEPGGFLYAVFSNNLKEAVGRADQTNLQYLTNIVSWCANNLPSVAWGSPERVAQWLELQRRNKLDELASGDSRLRDEWVEVPKPGAEI